MGVINITEDSFYIESRSMDQIGLLKKVAMMISDGATLIDLGAMSSRPGAVELSVTIEIERLRWACDIIHQYDPTIIISIDTYRVEVVQALSTYNVCMINDITGGQDPAIYSWAGQHRMPYVLMHMKGTPATMKSLATYDDMIKEMLDYFIERIPKLLSAGVHDIIIDPGFGFAKSIEQNFYLLKHLHVFQMLEFPIMVGLSRKSMIWSTLDISPGDSLNGTTALHMRALDKGARILRAHDVKEAVETIKLWTKMNH